MSYLNNMARNLLLGCGVPESILENYADECKISSDHLCHSSFMGVSDCTSSLPEGSVFLTGFGSSKQVSHHVFVTRFPCTEQKDGLLLPVISEKPSAMSEENWNFICNMHFGLIMFASPLDQGDMSLPEQIACGDLDGDTYFVCWNSEIISNMTSSSYKESDEDSSVDLTEEDECNLLKAAINTNFGGKMCDATVVEKTKEGSYLVKSGELEKHMSYDEITEEREILVDICSHRGKGKSIEIEILWGNEVKSWKKMHQIKNEMPNEVAEYARKKNLLCQKGWEWANTYVRNSEIVEIRDHRKESSLVEVEVLYDDGDLVWEPAKDIDVDILALYVQLKNINLNKKDWMWLKSAICEAKRNWFGVVQDHVCNVEYLSEHSKFVKKLCGKFKKRGDITNKDSIKFGRAYKHALEIIKHGGRVSLPQHLRDEVVSSTSTYADKFLKTV
mmetsp:Transcript_63294/g.74096  ORF Transcript_63294/g.74096 Transcript_63294/m.74096 type:complete len:445 (+) Transcript_63294:2-1336(+)